MDDVLKTIMGGGVRQDALITYSKKEFDPVNPDPELLDMADIAHGLSMICRSNGQFPQFFSIAQHCLQCAREAQARYYVPELVLACLLHNASKAYMGDVTRPVKQYLVEYRRMDKEIQNIIYQKFLGNIPMGEGAELVKNIDDACLYYEYKHFQNKIMAPVAPIMLSRPSYDTRPMEDVEKEFLMLAEELMGQIQANRA